MNWLIKFVKSPKNIDSIAPSSKSLGRFMVKNLKPNASVLELGTGSGSITKCILDKLAEPTTLTSIESDSDLYNISKNKFPKINLLNQDIQEILSQDKSFDFIISGVPFALMQNNRRHQLFHLIHERLTPKGLFIMFQYSTKTRDELRDIFGNIKTEFTPWNIPPAFIFTCKKD